MKIERRTRKTRKFLIFGPSHCTFVFAYHGSAYPSLLIISQILYSSVLSKLFYSLFTSSFKFEVSHLRVIRLRCSLCQAGSFFCTDLRVHLMFRHCEMLHLAGDDFGLPGTAVPCMDKKKVPFLRQYYCESNSCNFIWGKGHSS